MRQGVHCPQREGWCFQCETGVSPISGFECYLFAIHEPLSLGRMSSEMSGMGAMRVLVPRNARRHGELLLAISKVHAQLYCTWCFNHLVAQSTSLSPSN